MNRRNLLIAAVCLAGIGLLAYGTWCCLDWMAKRHVHAAHGSLWVSETWPELLGLSPDQRSKISSLENSLTQNVNGLQIELAHNQIALCRAMMSEAKLDPVDMRKAVRRISDLQTKREEGTLSHLLALREILSPDQQKKLFTTMMRDICQGCRTATGGKMDYCGMCPIR